MGGAVVRMRLDVCLPVIGVARTSYQELETTPIQAGLNRAGRGVVEIASRTAMAWMG